MWPHKTDESWWRVLTNGFHWRRETTSIFLPWEPHDSMKKKKITTLKDELPRSVGAQYATAEEHCYELQYFCLENSTERGAWWATVHGFTKSRTWLNNWQFTGKVCLMITFNTLSRIMYSSWGSQGKNLEVVCHSLLQWATFWQNSPPWPIHPGWFYVTWLIGSLSYTKL